MEQTKSKTVENYVNEKHNQDRCVGFIDGYEKALENIKPLFEKMLGWVEDDFTKGLFMKQLELISGVEEIESDIVEEWWNGLTHNEKRDFENKTFEKEWFEDTTIVYKDIETMYKKHVLNS